MDRFGGMREIAILRGRRGVDVVVAILSLGIGTGSLALGVSAMAVGAFCGARLVGGRGWAVLLHNGGGTAGASAFLPHDPAAQNAAGAAQGLGDALRGEIVGDALLLLGRCRAEQPQQQEEGHHGGHKVGIGDLPRATVVWVIAFHDAFDDDRVITRHDRRPCQSPVKSAERSFRRYVPRITCRVECLLRLNQIFISES